MLTTDEGQKPMKRQTNQSEISLTVELVSFQYYHWFISIDEQIDAYSNLTVQVINDGISTHKELVEKIRVPKKILKELHTMPDSELILPPEDMKDIKRFGDVVFKFAAVKTYSRQMIVLAASYLENILADFLKSFFYRYPQNMYDYLDASETQRGKVDLKDILEVADKEHLIYLLAMRASNNATQGKIKVVMKRIAKLTGEKISNNRVSNLVELVDKRNRIVHELSDTFVDPNEVSSAFEDLKLMLSELRFMAKKMDVPVDDRFE